MAQRLPAMFSWLQRDACVAIAIFTAALLVRLLFLFSSPDRTWPHSVWYEGDAPAWVEWARAIEAGRAFEFDLPLRAPAVAHVLHWFGATVPPFTGVKVLWCVLSSLACGVSYLAFRAQFSRAASLIAASLCALSFGMIMTATSLNSEALYALLLALMALATLRLREHPAWHWSIVAGIVHGMALLVRPEHALLAAMTLGYLAWSWRAPRDVGGGKQDRSRGCQGRVATRLSWRLATHRLLLHGAIMIAFMVLICLPWTMHGARAIHRFNTTAPPLPANSQLPMPWTTEARDAIEALPAFAREGNFLFITHVARTEGRTRVEPADVDRFFDHRFGYTPEPLSPWFVISMKGGLDFALANSPAAIDGGFSKAALSQSPDDIDPPLIFGRPDHLRLLNHGYAVGRSYIADDPAGWLSRVAAKLRNFISGATLGFTSLNLPSGLDGERRAIDVFTPQRSIARIIWQLALITLLMAGVAIAARQRRGGLWLLIILYKLLVIIAFYGYARQAVSILPAFYIFMALPIDALVRRTSQRQAKSLRWTAWIMIAGLLVAEVVAAMTRQPPTITGLTTPAPHLGEDAFTANRGIVIDG